MGQATIEIQTTLPLLVRPVLPRFFTAGDKAQISAIVNNNTEEDRTVEVTLASEAVTTDKPLSQIIAVPAKGQTKVTWPVDVPAPDGGLATTPGVIRFSAQETSGATPLADAVEITRADPALQLAGDHRDRRHRGAGRGTHRGHRAAAGRRSDPGRAARAA